MNQLLYDVRKDAIEKSKGIEFGEPFYKLIYILTKLSWTAEHEGLLSLEEVLNKLSTDIKFSEEMKWIGQLVYCGTPLEEIVEVATAQYWMNEYIDEEALMYYLVLRAFLKMQDNRAGILVEKFLMSYLPHDEEEKCIDYRKEVDAEQKSDNKKSLSEDESLLDEQMMQRLILE